MDVDAVVDTETATDTDTDTDADADEAPFDPYDVEAILEDRGVDVWHWKDPRIIPNQKERWEEHEKDRVYRAVVHLDDGRVVPLADLEMPEVDAHRQPAFRPRPLRSSLSPGDHLGGAVRAISMRSISQPANGDWRPGGSPAVGTPRPARSPPTGRFILYYHDGDWHLFDTEPGETRNLTADLPVPFADEDWDYPADPPGYGHSEWLADSSRC